LFVTRVRADATLSARQHHLQCERGEIAPVVLLPGDPARATLIASFLDEAKAAVEDAIVAALEAVVAAR
jgi:uridine phosphorylase